MAMRSKISPERIAASSLIWLAISFVGCARVAPLLLGPSISSRSEVAGREAGCFPVFPDQGGWLGGDAAYSVPLPGGDDRTSLWLFGDSFINTETPDAGRQYPFIHNSIALTHCRFDHDWRIEYFWGRRNDDRPRAFFEPDPNASWVRSAVTETGISPYYWLFDGFVVHDVLFIGLLRVTEAPERGPFNLPFRLLGMDLARIENYHDTPEDWTVQISELSSNLYAFPGSAFVATDDFVYAMTFFDRNDGRAPRTLSRIDTDAFLEWKPDLSQDFEYLAADSEWKTGFEPDDALILMDDDATEMSVYFDSDSETWLAVYSQLEHSVATGEQARRNPVRFRRAKSLEGPWSPPVSLFEIPERILGKTERNDKNLFCYAAKAHPQFSVPREILVTYVCSLFSRSADETSTILRRLLQSPDLYRPHAIRVQPPASPKSPREPKPLNANRRNERAPVRPEYGAGL